jgi:hypothetical protein
MSPNSPFKMAGSSARAGLNEPPDAGPLDRHIAFAVEDIDAVVAGLRALAEQIG